MRVKHTFSAALVALSMAILGGGYASLAAPISAYADPATGDYQFTLTHPSGATKGGETVTINARLAGGFTTVSAGDTFSLATGHDGNVWAWATTARASSATAPPPAAPHPSRSTRRQVCASPPSRPAASTPSPSDRTASSTPGETTAPASSATAPPPTKSHHE